MFTPYKRRRRAYILGSTQKRKRTTNAQTEDDCSEPDIPVAAKDEIWGVADTADATSNDYLDSGIRYESQEGMLIA